MSTAQQKVFSGFLRDSRFLPQRSYSMFAMYGYYLHLDAQGGIFPSRKTVETLVSSSNGSIYRSVIDTLNPTRTGYDFVGWSATPDGPVIDLNPYTSYKIDGNTTFYAKWKRRHYLTLNANAGSFNGLTTIHIPADANGRISAAELQRYVPTHDDGAELDITSTTSTWNTKADGSGQGRSTASDITLSTDEKWFAQWLLPEKFVTFDANTSPDDVTHGEGTVIGWCRNSSYPGCAYQPSWHTFGNPQLAYESQDHPFTTQISSPSNEITKIASTKDPTFVSRGGTFRAQRPANSSSQDANNNHVHTFLPFAGWSLEKQDLTEANVSKESPDTPYIPDLLPFPGTLSQELSGGEQTAAPSRVTVQNADSESAWLGGSSDPTNPTTLYAAYPPVRFNLEDGRDDSGHHSDASLTVADSLQIGSAFPVPSRDDFVFNYWYQGSAQNTTQKCYPENTTTAGEASQNTPSCRIDADHRGTWHAMWTLQVRSLPAAGDNHATLVTTAILIPLLTCAGAAMVKRF